MFTFQFLNDTIYSYMYHKKPFGKIGVLVNFIIQKLKSKHLVCLNFALVTGFFEGTRETILHIFRAYDARQILIMNFTTYPSA